VDERLRFERTQGIDGYAGTQTLAIAVNSPDQSFSAGELSFDQATSDYGAPEAVALGLIRFDELFGAHGLPEGAPISGAELRFWTTSSTTGPVGLHRMLVPWDGDTTWNSLGEGVAADDSEARAISDDSQADLQGNAYVIFDVTDSVQAWAEGAPNHGWLILNTSTDGWDVATELYEGDQATDRRPRLTIYYAEGVASDAVTHRLGNTNDDVEVQPQTDTLVRYLDFGGIDRYQLPMVPTGAIEIVDNQPGTVILPAGLTLEAAAFLADGVQLTVSGQTMTLIGNPGAFTYVLAGNLAIPDAGLAYEWADFADLLGASIPAPGASAVMATKLGTVLENGQLAP
jgi:hypothetical protein